MKVLAKCHNYSGCLKAYKGETIELADGAPLVCPECGKAATIESSPAARYTKIGAVIVLSLALLGTGAYFALPLLQSKNPAPPAGEPPARVPVVSSVPLTPAAEPAEPPTAVTAPEKIDLNAASTENKRIKAEVLKRVDVIPNLSRDSKDKLYASVDRARSMGKILTVPFKPGKITVSAEDIEALKTEIGSSAVKVLRDDPTAVFVLLGFADPSGDTQKNIAVSQGRADAVLAVMRDKCGVTNVMHAVAIGAAKILDTQKLEKNRIVEIWAVLP